MSNPPLHDKHAKDKQGQKRGGRPGKSAGHQQEGIKMQREQMPRNEPGVSQVIGAKEDPGKRHEAESEQYLGGGHQSGEAIQAERLRDARSGGANDLGRDQIEAMEQAPNHKSPVRSVPQPTDGKRDHQIEIVARQFNPVAAQWDVDVIAKPGGERYVPAVPEFSDRTAEIGLAEIDSEIVAHHAG